MIDEKDDFIKSYYDAAHKLFGISMDDFLKYYGEAKYSGYPEEGGGAVWKSEGKFLYMMIRHLKPLRILEIGNFKGRGTTNHILQAIDDNKVGQVVLLDILENLEYDRLHSKDFERVIDDSLKYLNKPFTFDLIVHDGSHEYEHVKKELELMSENTTQSFWIWSHDWFKVLPPQCEVKRAWKDIKSDNFTNITPLKDSVSDCGFVVSEYIKLQLRCEIENG